MIFPFLNGLAHPFKAPFTYFLLALNVLVFLGTFNTFESADKRLDLVLDDDSFLSIQGNVFAEMIEAKPAGYTQVLQDIAHKVEGADPEMRKMLGNLALRNGDFMAHAATTEFSGDVIEIQEWRAKFLELLKLQDEHPSYQWGVSLRHSGWRQWITYQFAHSGWAHLFWNMLFLVLFGSLVETTLGGSFVMIAYLGGGLVGALSFSALSGFSASPLVGASAAVSGLMGLVAFAWWNRGGVKFFFWLLPIQGYFGFRMLPSWLVLIVSVVPDLSGYLASSNEFGSVAHSAHLGGIAFGAIMAWLLSRGWMIVEVPAAEKAAARI